MVPITKAYYKGRIIIKKPHEGYQIVSLDKRYTTINRYRTLTEATAVIDTMK